MAAFYELRYWKNFEQPDGSIIRLEIHSKGIEGVSFTAYEIGPVVQALALTIQGQTEDVDAPIVKTSLTMTFVDAPDHADAWLKKCGDWEEFYTNDATMWKVILKGKKNASSSSYAQLWGGYITPDSFSEELRYRGSVTIVARDNIGHMQDFPFDAEGDENGMISLRELVRAAWEKIESPMELYLEDARQWMQCDGVQAYNTMMNASAFKGMNWYEAVEKALYAYGAVMRYNGQNEVLVSSLRYMPQQGKGNMDAVTHIEPVFIAHAQRELVPAVRRIEETVEYDLSEAIQPLVELSDFSGATSEVKDATGFTARVYDIINLMPGHGWVNPSSDPIYFNPAVYTLTDAEWSFPFTEDEKEQLPSSMMLLCNNKEGEAIYSRYVHAVDCQFKIGFGNRYLVNGPNTNQLYKQNQDYCKIIAVKYSVRVTKDGITHYLQENGEWGVPSATLTISSNTHIGQITIAVPFKEAGNVLLELVIKSIELDQTLYNHYVVIHSLTLENLSSAPLLKKNTVNTMYQEHNNVIISRNPEFAPAYNVTALPGFIKNGIFYYDGNVIKPAKAWNWNGGTPQQMAVYNHLQLLCYHSKPNNLITGDIVNADVIKTAAIYVWGGAEHLLISGTYNYLNGRIEGAVLREFVRYDDMWGDVTGSSLPDVQTDSTTNAEEGGPSSSGVINENTTNVVIGGEGGGSVTIDPFLSDTSSNPVESKAIKAYIDSADNEIKERIAALEEGGGNVGHPVFEFEFDSATNKATAEMVSALAEAIAADKLIVCNGRTYKFILEQDGMYGLVSDTYLDIMDGKLKASVLAVMASTYDVQLAEEEVPTGTEITEATIRNWGFTKNAGTITGIKMNGATKGTSGVVDLGNVLTEHQKLKTINGQSIVGEGNITIQGGGATPRVEMTETSAELLPNTFHVWPMVDSLDLTLGAEQSGVMNRYLFQFRNPKAGVTLLTLPDDITWSEDTELDENGMPVMEAAAFYRIEIIEGLASLKKWELVYINFADAEVERVLMDNGVGDGIGITKRDAKKVTSIGTWFQGNENIKSFDELAFFIGVTELSEEAFEGCTALKDIGLDHVRMATRTFGNGSFSGCTSLKKVVMPAIEELKWTFMDCTSLEVADIGENCTSIAWRTFQNCPMYDLVCRAVVPPTMEDTSLSATCMIYVPDESVEAYKTAPGWSSRAAYIKGISGYDPSYGSRVIVFADSAVAAIILSNFGNKDDEFTQREADAVTSLGTFFRDNTEITSFDELNDFHNVTVLKDGVFAGCTALESIGLDNITDISRTSNKGVFNGCTALKAVTMPKVVNLAWSFMGCTSLSFAEIGENCTTIAWRTFQNCPMTTLICRAVTPPTMADTSLVSTCNIYVPDESVEAYKAANGWSGRAAYIKGISEYTG